MSTRCLIALILGFCVVSSAFAQQPRSGYAVEIDLQDQMAHLLEDGRPVLSTPISSGRAGHYTQTGVFKITEKERNHYSNLYGKIVDARGNTIVGDADSDMPVPRGGKFVPAPMSYFMRFDGATGMHAGYLPGYAASHGCVRLPEANAIAIFNAVEVGTPVTVFGVTPRGRQRQMDSRDYTMQRRTRDARSPRPDLRGFDPALQARWTR